MDTQAETQAQPFTEQRLLSMVRMGIDIAGSQKAFAAKVGISEQYLTDILKGRRPVGTAKKLLDAYGLERVVMFRRKDGGTRLV